MGKQTGVKRTVSISLFALTVLFTFLSLAFTILKKEWNYFGIKHTFNGYTLMYTLLQKKEYSNPSMGTGFDSWLILYCFILLVGLLVELIVYGVLAWKKSKKLVCMERLFVIVNVLLTLVYMINGLCARRTWMYEIDVLTPSTAAYIPFIIVSVLAAAYFVAPRLIKNSAKTQKE